MDDQSTLPCQGGLEKNVKSHKKGGLELTGRVGKISGKNAKIAKKCMKMKELEDIFGKLRSSVLPKF